MDFSNSAFRSKKPQGTFSNDAMSHTQMVQACRWSFGAGPNGTGDSAPPMPTPLPTQRYPTTSSYDTRPKRLTPCRGRLYHQLACSHRVRTDLVVDCGSNCLEPFGAISNLPFYCQECVSQEASNAWQALETQHNALYPPMDQMTKVQYEIWYDEHRQLEAKFSRDRRVYESELKANTRPTNVCSALEMSKEDADFATEIDALSLSLTTSNDSTVKQPHTPMRSRITLPNDASEQLHWSLNSLAIDRGSCGMEYSSPSSPLTPTMRSLNKEELWRMPRSRN